MPTETATTKTPNPVGQMSSLLNMSAANWPNRGRTVSLDFDNSDFFYFQTYDVGQYSPQELKVGNSTQVSYGPSPSQSVTVDNIKHMNIKCSATDLATIDASFCDPASPNFVKLWADPSNNETVIERCYRAQTCANSLLSQSLSSMTASKGGQEKRKQDLEDIYFYDCMNVFNMCIAILYFLYIIITKLALPSTAATAATSATAAATNLLPSKIPTLGK